jgi:hypothetical protein
MWPLCFINHDRIPEWDYNTHVGRVFSRNDPRNADRGVKSYDCVVKHDDRYEYQYVDSLKPEVRPPAISSFTSPPHYGPLAPLTSLTMRLTTSFLGVSRLLLV